MSLSIRKFIPITLGIIILFNMACPIISKANDLSITTQQTRQQNKIPIEVAMALLKFKDFYQQVQQKWPKLPNNLNQKPIVMYSVSTNGISDCEIIQSSLDPAIDQAAIDAVLSNKNLLALPIGYPRGKDYFAVSYDSASEKLYPQSLKSSYYTYIEEITNLIQKRWKSNLSQNDSMSVRFFINNKGEIINVKVVESNFSINPGALKYLQETKMPLFPSGLKGDFVWTELTFNESGVNNSLTAWHDIDSFQNPLQAVSNKYPNLPFPLVLVQIAKNGQINKSQILHSSGDNNFDSEILQAIQTTPSLKPLDSIYTHPMLNMLIWEPNWDNKKIYYGLDFNEYIENLQNKIRKNWHFRGKELKESSTISVQFGIDKAGNVVFADVVDSTNPALNEKRIATIMKSSPFPPLPIECPYDYIVTEFTFNLEIQKLKKNFP